MVFTYTSYTLSIIPPHLEHLAKFPRTSIRTVYPHARHLKKSLLPIIRAILSYDFIKRILYPPSFFLTICVSAFCTDIVISLLGGAIQYHRCRTTIRTRHNYHLGVKIESNASIISACQAASCCKMNSSGFTSQERTSFPCALKSSSLFAFVFCADSPNNWKETMF